MKQNVLETKKWFLTDDGTIPQWVSILEPKEKFAILEIEAFKSDEETVYAIKENTISISDFSEEVIKDNIEPYGYESTEHAKEVYGDEFAQVIAECIAETRTLQQSDCTTEVHSKETLSLLLKEKYGIDYDLNLTFLP